ncbi:unnamed protein product [Ilex paraguariensis]|uniref:Uncharacterized protein n=1 Tax=Ilex paraguariensis TaxID=185542 RepID=A0ABC8QL04_9AQUA
MISSNLDPSFNQLAACSSFSSVRGPNSSPLTVVGSAFLSATALFQKAAEMGAKISSDNSIAPVPLRGFTGYCTSNMNSSGSVQEASSIGGGPNMGHIPVTTNGSYAGNPKTFGKITDARNQRG